MMLDPNPAKQTSGSEGQDASEWSEAGYNLVILLVLVTILNIMVGAALPAWTHLAKREKEEELIFRGMQYAEAIRVFQQRHGRFPVRLEELLETEPRSIRQLFEDPMTEHGSWGLLIQAARPTGGGQQRRGAAQRGDQNRQPAAAGPERQKRSQGGAQDEIPAGVGFPGRERGGRGRVSRAGGNMVAIPPSTETEDFGRPTQRTTGPIVGVYSATDEESLRVFAGQQNYSQWHFHIGLIPTPVMLGGENPAPRVHSNWVGKPFRSDLEVKPPGASANRGRDATQGRDASPRGGFSSGSRPRSRRR